MKNHYRLAIIGAGTAGLTALKYAQRSTDNIVLINHGPYGTTCARVGCMPSKALLDPAHALAHCRALAAAGIEGTAALRADIPAVLAHVRGLRDRFIRGPIRLAEELGEHSVEGRARFLDPNTLQVGTRRITAEHILIATGSQPLVPAPWRALGARVLTSDDLFEQLDLGPRVAVVGLGPLGAELGQGLAMLGLEVHGFSLSPRVAGLSDVEVNDALLAVLRQQMRVTTGVEVRLEAAGDAAVKVLAGDQELEVDWVLAAMGRRPNLADMGLENLGVALDQHGMPPFNPRTLQVADLPVYLAGDVNHLHPILHEAADDGRLAAHHALTGATDCLGRRTPMGVVFTEPNAVWVGKRRRELTEADIVIGKVSFARQGRALTMGRNAGQLHVYVDRATTRVLGAELAAPDGEHLAHLLAWAIQQDLGVDELLQMPFYHPVVEEGLRSALHDARRQLPQPRPLLDLPLCEPPVAWALGAD